MQFALLWYIDWDQFNFIFLSLFSHPWRDLFEVLRKKVLESINPSFNLNAADWRWMLGHLHASVGLEISKHKFKKNKIFLKGKETENQSTKSVTESEGGVVLRDWRFDWYTSSWMDELCACAGLLSASGRNYRGRTSQTEPLCKGSALFPSC